MSVLKRINGDSLISMFSLRLLSIIMLFIGNLYLVKLFPLDAVGYYYLLTALAYFGHSLYFLGCDYYLQSKMKNTSVSRAVNLPSLLNFLLKTSLPGLAVVFSIASLFFMLVEKSDSVILNTAVIVLISLSTYLSLAMKNILQIADFKIYFLAYLIVESAIKLFAILAFGFTQFFNPIMLLLCIYLLGLLQFTVYFFILSRETVSCSKIYFRGYRSLLFKVFPTAKSAVVNWLHLQAYRPASSMIGISATNLGILSYLIALGGSTSQAFIGLIFQKMLPRIYSSNGEGTRQFLFLLFVTCIVLVLLSLPVSVVFIDFVGKTALQSYFWLVAVGVVIEFLNATVGVIAVFANIRSVSMMNKISTFNLYGFVSLIICYIVLLDPIGDVVIRFSLSLLASQVIVSLLALNKFFKFKEN